MKKEIIVIILGILVTLGAVYLVMKFISFSKIDQPSIQITPTVSPVISKIIEEPSSDRVKVDCFAPAKCIPSSQCPSEKVLELSECTTAGYVCCQAQNPEEN